MLSNKIFLVWWAIFCIQLLLLAISAYFNLHLVFLLSDITYISSIIFVVYILTSLYIGFRIAKRKFSNEISWFITDSFTTLGLLGTVIGLIFILGKALVNVDVSNIETMKTAIVIMSSGMSTALLTTLAGLIATLSIKLQLVVQDYLRNET